MRTDQAGRKTLDSDTIACVRAVPRPDCDEHLFVTSEGSGAGNSIRLYDMMVSGRSNV